MGQNQQLAVGVVTKLGQVSVSALTLADFPKL